MTELRDVMSTGDSGLQRTCFVISQIGDKGSEVRKHADDVFDLIIEPALEKFGFQVIRADKLSSVTSITSEIIELVQHADLCVIDISGHNPNVMYECGRRHETGSPYIMLAKDGEKLPFDVNTIRTIFYNLADSREIRATVKGIQAVVEKMVGSGFQSQGSGESLSSIADTLKRIERKLGDLEFTRATAPHPGAIGSVSSRTQEVVRSLGAIGAFNYALTEQDVQLAEELMPRLERTSSREKFIKMVLTQVAGLGSRIAAQRLELEVIPNLRSFSVEDQKGIIGAYVRALNLFDEELRALPVLNDFIEHVKNSSSTESNMSASDRAYFLNQYQKLLHGGSKYQEAREIGVLVINLRPDEASYYFNQSINEQKLENMKAALENITKCLALDDQHGTLDDDHLSQAVRLYSMIGDADKAKRAFTKLQIANSLQAALVQEEDVVKKILGGNARS